MTPTRVILHLFVVITVLSTSLAWTCPDDSYYLSVSYGLFFAAATGGRRINGCYIQQGGGACDLYAKTPTRGAINPGIGRGYNGWPRTPDGRGTGCVRAPTFPRHVNTCYYRSPVYGLSSSFVDSICTSNGITNVVRQLKDAIRKGQCNECEQSQNPIGGGPPVGGGGSPVGGIGIQPIFAHAQ